MIHPTAVVDPGARLADDVVVEAFSWIGADVEIGPGSRIGPHAVVDGPSVLGAGVQIFPFASVGLAPQDLKYKNEPTTLEMGDRCIVRECVTVQRGTVGGVGVTRVGRECLLMAYCHVAHDCQVGDGVIMANSASLAGHVCVHDHAILGGLVGIHQFVTIGALAMVGAGSMISKDVVPFVHVVGNRDVHLYGVNSIGLKRHGYSEDRVQALKKAYRMLFRGKQTAEQAMQAVESELGGSADVQQMLNFIRTSKRGVYR